MSQIPALLKELEQEAQTTRKMLRIIPDDKFDWKPHVKSMNIRTLATHIAELPSWITLALTTDELDFATAPYNPPVIETTAALLALFEMSLADGKSHLEKAEESLLTENWTLRQGEQIFSVMTKYETIRHAYSQTVHHRAQLGVYLRLLDIPIPGSYGPSADDMSF
jgi:uncharacterized damage-inducible protein DinB